MKRGRMMSVASTKTTIAIAMSSHNPWSSAGPTAYTTMRPAAMHRSEPPYAAAYTIVVGWRTWRPMQ